MKKPGEKPPFPDPLKKLESDQEMVYIAKLMVMGFSEEEIKQILDLDKLFD